MSLKMSKLITKHMIVNYKSLPENCLCSLTSVFAESLSFEPLVKLNCSGVGTLPARRDTSGCLFDMCRSRLPVLPLRHLNFFLQIWQRAAPKLFKFSKCLQIKLRALRLDFTESWPIAPSSALCSTGPPCAASKMPLIDKLMSVSFTVLMVWESSSSIGICSK